MKFFVIVATDEKGGIGIENRIPWRLPSDIKHFAEVTKTSTDATKKNAVIMGRKTWESLPGKFRPLPERINIVLSQNPLYELPEGVTLALDLDVAMVKAEQLGADRKFIIGGGRIFEEALKRPDCAGVYLTKIFKAFDCDTFVAPIDEKIFTQKKESEILEENGLQFQFIEYKRKD